MAKKDLQAAAAHGADLFFSTNDAQETVVPHKAQDEQPTQLANTVQQMQETIIIQEQERAARRAERKAATAAKHAAMKRIYVEISPEAYDFVLTMGAVSGKGISKFVSDLLERELSTNSDIYNKLKGLLANARK